MDHIWLVAALVWCSAFVAPFAVVAVLQRVRRDENRGRTMGRSSERRPDSRARALLRPRGARLARRPGFENVACLLLVAGIAVTVAYLVAVAL